MYNLSDNIRRTQMSDVVPTLNGRRPISVLDINLIKALKKDEPDAIDAYVKSKGMTSEINDFFLQVIIDKKLKLLERLLSLGVDVNAETIHGRPIIMTFYKGRVNHEVILFLMKYKIDLNFKIVYDKIEVNFLDLAVYLVGADPILSLFANNGAVPNDKLVIPFGPNLLNNSYNMFVIGHVYSPSSTYNGINVIDYLMSYDYKKYAGLISRVNLNPDDVKLSTRVLLICRLVRESINHAMVQSLLGAIPANLTIDSVSLPVDKLEFLDFVSGMNTLKSSSNIVIVIDTHYILTWFFSLPCDPNLIVPLQEAGIDLNAINTKVEVSRDWQMALLQNGIGGGKSKGSFIKLRSNTSKKNQKSEAEGKLIGKAAKNINKYILTKEMITAYESFIKSTTSVISTNTRKSRGISARLGRGKSLSSSLSKESILAATDGEAKSGSLSARGSRTEEAEDVTAEDVSELRATLRQRSKK